MSIKFDWLGWLKTVIKASIPFFSGALGGL